jgi:hypothetical protein
VTGLLARAGRTALGRDYEHLPVGQRADASTVRGYPVDYSPKTYSPGAAVPETLAPAGLAQRGLGGWGRHLAGETGARDQFLRVCRLLAETGERTGAGLLWRYSDALPKYGLGPGWLSALAQGQAASTLVRAYVETGEECWAELAGAAADPLLDQESALVSSTPDGPVLEEVPSEPASHVLNGWISGLWGLWDLGSATGERRASRAFADGLECLERRLDRYDTGWWTLYSLYPHRLRDLAKPIYHRFHVTQMRGMHRLTGSARFGVAAERWAAYDTPIRRGMALTQKGLFAGSRFVAERARTHGGGLA